MQSNRYYKAIKKRTPPKSFEGNESSSSEPPELRRILAKLRSFQRKAFDKCTGYPNIDQNDGETKMLIADEMGLGKTVTALAIMTLYMREWPLLVLCPASLRYTWPSEIEKFIPSLSSSSVYVISGFDDVAFSKRKDLKIVIATYSLLQKRAAVSRSLMSFGFHCVIADESHCLKEKTSQRCKFAVPILKGANRLLLLSGTPALARPVELWSQLNCLDDKTFGTYTSYTNKYCDAKRGRFGWDVSGASNLDELHNEVNTFMIRRLKSQVLHELPTKQRSIVPISAKDKTLEKQCSKMIEDLKETRLSVQDLVGDDARNAHFEARKLLMSAYQASGISKASAVAEYIIDWLNGSGTQKLLVFAHHQDVLDTIENSVSKKFRGLNHIRIDGKVGLAERARLVNKFQTDPSTRIALLSVTAAGVGLTLTAASTVIFSELHWTPGVLLQAEDRCHRIGQRNAVNIMYCVCRDRDQSIDMIIWDMLTKKIGNLGIVFDGNKGASLSVQNGDCSGHSGMSAKSMSCQTGEEELTSFFSKAKISNKTDNLQLVKGSIQSFFSKTVSNKVNNSEPPSKSFQSPPCHPLELNSIANEEISWSCKHCTFINLTPKKSSNQPSRVTCEVCGIEQLILQSVAVTPGSASRKEDFAATKELGRQSRDIYLTNGVMEANHPIAINIDEDLGLVGVDNLINFDSSSSEGIDIREGSKFPVLLDVDRGSALEKASASMKSQYDDVIEIDGSSDDSDVEIIVRTAHLRKHRKSLTTSTSDEANMMLSLTCNGQMTAVKSRRCSESNMKVSAQSRPEGQCFQASTLNFSASKNSGRIALHLANGQLLHSNFAIDDVINYNPCSMPLNTSDKYEKIKFDDSAIRSVLSLIDKDVLKVNDASFNYESFQYEIKEFINNFLSLREVEKKALMTGEVIMDPYLVHQEAARAIVSSVTGSTSRYGGGAREKAASNAQRGIASSADLAVLNNKACAWCAKHLSEASSAKGVMSIYCSQACAEEGRLRCGGMSSMQVRLQVFGLEKGVCQRCGVDAHALYLRIKALQPPERLNALCNANWNLPKTGAALERLLQHPKEGDFWQADHIVAVSEGGGSCGLDNLQTLCTPCHLKDTEKLRSRLRLSGGAKSDILGKGQQDIRATFSQARPRKRKSAD